MSAWSRYRAAFFLLTTAACGSRVAAQPDTSDSKRIACQKLPKLINVRSLASVPTQDSLEACHALSLAVAAASKRYPGRVDSALVWRHDFPELNTSNVESVYQIGVFISPQPYVEVIVDRKTWATSVRRLER